MSIILSPNRIKQRSNEIKNLIKPLSKNGNSVSCKIAPSQRDSIVFGTFGGKQPLNTNYRDWHFKTHKNSFNASYFEIWMKELNEFSLVKAYFRLMLNENNLNRELLSLHIDPTEESNIYKMGPHIHVKTEIDIISRAHISLNLQNLDSVIHSFEEFKLAYNSALTMINDEILKPVQIL